MAALSVVGLGKLGMCMAACLAHRGYDVIGVDVDTGRVTAVNEGRPPIQENGLDELMRASGGRLRATTDYREAVRQSEITFIVVATPSLADGSYSNAQLEAAIREIGRALRDKPGYHVVAVTSTVMPGTTEGVVKPILEETSGRRCGEGFGLAYNPEFIALGSVIRDLLNPEFVLIGEMDRVTGDRLEDVYRQICVRTPAFARMSPINAEIAKLSVNCYVTMKISFANTLAEVCERVPGGDVDAVTAALGLDSRIGPKYLRGGLGFGGPCFPRDNRAFVRLAEQHGLAAEIAVAVDRVNERQVDRLVAMILGCGPVSSVAILGLAYKPGTHIVDDSQPVEIARHLSDRGLAVSVFDPLALDTARRLLGGKVRYATSVEDCVAGTDLCVVATPWPEFQALDPATLARLMKPGAAVVDCWRLLATRGSKGVRLIRLGHGPEEREDSS